MTFRERLRQEHPKYIGPQFDGGCLGCPVNYGYEKRPHCHDFPSCDACWDREIPEAEEADDAEYITPQEVIRAARLLRDFCAAHPMCMDCPLDDPNALCKITDRGIPEHWEIPEDPEGCGG